jgi:ATP-dependent protease ClpP protease subunit
MRQRLRNYARVQPNQQWFKIVNLASGPTQVMLYNEIGFFGVSAQDFNDQLSGIDGPIDLFINSPGGEIFDGISIFNQLLRHQDVSVFIDGIAASAASFIAQAASPGKLGMAKNAKMMVHNGQAFAAGDAAELRKMAELLDAETANIASIYADRSGRPAGDFLTMMANESWLSATQACDEGLADFVYDPRKGPQNVVQTRNASGGNAGWVRRDGKWCFDPDGDGDDDSTPSGDKDHDYWSADGKQLKSIPPDPDGKQGKPLAPGNAVDVRQWLNADKYKQADRDDMAQSGQAMKDGSYPIKDAEDLAAAIKAVGRGNADHDDIRKHIIERAAALKLSSQIPDNWNADGSLKSSPGDAADLGAIGAFLSNALKG